MTKKEYIEDLKIGLNAERDKVTEMRAHLHKQEEEIKRLKDEVWRVRTYQELAEKGQLLLQIIRWLVNPDTAKKEKNE